jgi:hypothetical protein
MGNRAIIKTEGGHIGLYLHWNGGRDSVEAFLTYCKMRGFRSPETDGYGWARLAQVIGNWFGGTTSLGIVEVGENSGEYCDNGAYIIRNWEIVGRENFDGPEQQEYDLLDMIQSIDEAQPERDRIGDYLKATIVPTKDLKPGDKVIFLDWNGEVKTGTVIGFGGDTVVNGQDVNGKPYMDLYSMNDHPETNINNYILTETARKPAPETVKPAEESPVEIFINEQLKGIELKFKARPSEEVRAELKASGWKWHHKKAVWYAKNDPEHMAKAQQLAAAATK